MSLCVLVSKFGQYSFFFFILIFWAFICPNSWEVSEHPRVHFCHYSQTGSWRGPDFRMPEREKEGPDLVQSLRRPPSALALAFRCYSSSVNTPELSCCSGVGCRCRHALDHGGTLQIRCLNLGYASDFSFCLWDLLGGKLFLYLLKFKSSGSCHSIHSRQTGEKVYRHVPGGVLSDEYLAE